MKAKLDTLGEDLKEEKAERRAGEQKFVTLQHFQAVVEPMQRQLTELGKDVKKILVIVSRHRGGEEECGG